MTRGKLIPLKTKCQIRERRAAGASVDELMRDFKVSRRSVLRACSRGLKKPKKAGRPRAITPAEIRKLVVQARKTPRKSASTIAELAGVSVSSRTAQRELRRKTFQKKRMRKTPKLSPTAIAKRLAFAKHHLENPTLSWAKVMFSDEKKWNLCGNDGYVSIWKEESREYTFEVDLRRRPGIMVWGAICSNGAAFISRIDRKINAATYQNMLAEVVFDENTQILPEGFVFQQDNAPAHTAATTRDFFMQRSISVLEWPPYSPDLNIIENVWGIVSKKVYEGGKSYETCDELWESVSNHFLAISDETVQNLFQSIPSRLVQVVELRGKRTQY